MTLMWSIPGKLIDPNTMKGAVTFPQYGKGTWTAERKP